MLIEAIKKLEAAGFTATYTMNSVKFAKPGGDIEAEINADAPTKSWANGAVLQALSDDRRRGVWAFIDLIAQKKLKMPDLFILDTDNGMIQIGDAVRFTKKDPTVMTGKQVDSVRLRVIGMNPKTYKVN
nr:MAG TPA: hypothetical protein [Caudoviricetes sp.]